MPMPPWACSHFFLLSFRNSLSTTANEKSVSAIKRQQPFYRMTMQLKIVLSLIFCLLRSVSSQPNNDIEPFLASPQGTVQGIRRRWHRITIAFQGPETDELNQAINPFTDYRLDATFVHEETGQTYVVPGFYAADGDAANTGASTGDVWLVHFAPDLVGEWAWSVSFVAGRRVAQQSSIDGSPSAGFFDGSRGRFSIEETDKTGGRDHRGKGRLNYVNKHHLQFSNGDWFLKGGADSPENFLAYDDFDGTPDYKGRRKSWQPHLRDSRDNDPTWAGGKGKSILGALNYLALQKGMNAFSFLTMNIDGDDKNVFPYVSDDPANDAYERIDVSKLAQWEVVFSHADKVGLFLHFKTQETENDHLLDDGDLGNQRRLYYRELIARFGHHMALNWNIGEENTNARKRQLEFAEYFKTTDPYDHPIVIHTKPDQRSKNNIYGALVGSKFYDGASIQATQADIFNDTLTWINESEKAGQPWVVANDEQGGAGVGIVPDGEDVDPNHDDARAKVLWANLMAGGAGVEYYFGFRFKESDMNLQDYRSRDQFFDQTRFALRFFSENSVPFWEMKNLNQPSFDGKWCLANEARDILVMYLENTKSVPSITLSGSTNAPFSVSWYNPRTGGRLEEGSVRSLRPGDELDFGLPPSDNDAEDWVVLLRQSNRPQPTRAPTTSPPRVVSTASPSISPVPRPSSKMPSASPIISPVPLPSSEKPTRSPTIAPIPPQSPDVRIPHSFNGEISGSRTVGGDIRIGFIGPNTGDNKVPSPQERYRMTIWVFPPSSPSFYVDGQYAGNGYISQLERNDKRGRVWAAQFSPTLPGRYWWLAELRMKGEDGTEQSAGFFNDEFGTFMVE